MPRENKKPEASADQPKSWEERIVDLEHQTKQKDATIADQRATIGAQQEALSEQSAKVAAQAQQIEALQGTVEALKAAEDARKKAAIESRISGAVKQAAKAGKPIAEDKLTTIRAAYGRGDEETGDALLDAHLQLSLATGGGSVGGTATETVTLGVEAADYQKATDASLQEFRARRMANSPYLQELAAQERAAS